MPWPCPCWPATPSFSHSSHKVHIPAMGRRRDGHLKQRQGRASRRPSKAQSLGNPSCRTIAGTGDWAGPLRGISLASFGNPPLPPLVPFPEIWTSLLFTLGLFLCRGSRKSSTGALTWVLGLLLFLLALPPKPCLFSPLPCTL